MLRTAAEAESGAREHFAMATNKALGALHAAQSAEVKAIVDTHAKRLAAAA